MLRLFLFTLVNLLCFHTYNVVAIEVTTLYQAQTPIQIAGRDGQTQALREVMKKVLVKASGIRDIVDDPAIKSALQNPNSYLLQFKFENVQQQRFLQAEFDSRKINRLLLQAQLPLWGNRRPLVLVWLATEQENGYRRLVADSDGSTLSDELERVTEERGLPILLPLADITDLSSLDLLDVWGRFVEPVSIASERYGSDRFVVARLFKVDAVAGSQDATLSEDDPLLASETEVNDTSLTQHWRIDWRIPDNNIAIDNSVIAATPEQAVAAFADGMADHFASHYSIESNGEFNEYLLTINNVNSIQYLVDIERYLRSLTQVGDVLLVEVDKTKMVFKLVLLGQQADVKQALSLGNRLQLIRKPFADPDAQDEYIWMPKPL